MCHMLIFQSDISIQKASKSLDCRGSSARSAVKKSVRKVRPWNKQQKSLETQRPVTPENLSMASSTGGKTSTPTMDRSALSHTLDIDASAIHAEVSMQQGEIVMIRSIYTVSMHSSF